MLNSVLLKRLNVINETGSFTKAAEKLFISRQALVEQVSTLEKQIGFHLFERTNRGTHLTVAGEMYLSNSLRLLGSYHDLVHKCNETASGVRSITVGALPNLPGITLPIICKEYHKLHPEVIFHFRDFPLTNYFEEFHDNAFDVTNEYIMNYYHNDKDLCFLPLKQVPQHIGVLHDSPLAQKKRLSFADLRGHALAMYRGGIGKAEDKLRAYIRSSEPNIRIVDIDNYDSSLITKCVLEDAVVLLYTVKSFPALISIPTTWDIKIDLGIGYHRNPGQDVQELLTLAEDLNKKIDLL